MAQQPLPEAGGLIRIGGVTIEVAGLAGSIREAPTSRGESAIPEELLAALSRQEARPAAPLLEIDARIATRRGAPAVPPVARLRPPTQRGDEVESFALVVEEDGLLRWALPNADGTIDVPLEPTGDDQTRGIVGGLIRKGIQWITAPLVDAVLGRIGEHFVRSWEERNRPHRLRLVGSDITRLPDHDLTERQARDLLEAPTLLLIHGTISSTESGFAGLAPYLADLRSHYGNRVVAFDHPTLGFDPDENARWLAQRLRRLLEGRGSLVVDVLGHSRGGLVSRVLTERQQAIGLPPGLLEVRSVTFAGTPNAGTPLCDPAHLEQLIDTYTNLLTLVPGGVVDAMEVVVTVVRQLAAGFYSGLDGAMAMNPRGTWLRNLNRPTSARSRYRAITADYEPPADAAVTRRLRDLVTDRVFAHEPNDLVVPTDGTVGDNGSPLFPIATRLRLDPQPESAVDHFKFFDHPDSVSQLKAWLVSGVEEVQHRAEPASPRPASRPAAAAARRGTVVAPQQRVPVSAVDEALASGDVARLRRVIDALDDQERRDLVAGIGGPLPRRDTSRGGKGERRRPVGTVIVVPGIMGSHLDVVDGARANRVWVHVWRLLTGQFPQLRYGAASVRATELYRVYIPLLLTLDVDHEVVPFAYDWRQPLRDSADALARVVRDVRAAGSGPVHVVAHSMGGLVARHMIARDPDPWRESGGRLVQLGTPNHGSFSIPLVLTGHDRVVSWLALADAVSTKTEILEIVRGFPGVYQLLPSPGVALDDDHALLYDARRWPEGLSAELLEQARSAHEELARAPHHADRLALVLGTDHPTAFRLLIDDGRFTYGRTVHGDGRVPHELARLDGVATYYSTADHGGLVVAPEVLDALPALLADERPERLPTDDPAATRGVESETPTPTLPPEELVPAPPQARGSDGTRSTDERIEMVTEVTRDWLGTSSAPRTARTLEVEVVHGRLQHAAGPWLLGHVAGTPLSGSELALDRRLSGELSRHHLVREYPEQVGEPLVIGSGQHGDEAIVVGLGPWGDLSTPQLSESVSRGVLRYLVSAGAAQRPILELSTVLIGSSGEAGLPVQQSVTAVTAGVLAANRQASVVRGAGGVAPAIERLRFVELYEEVALQAARTVTTLPQELDPQSVGDTDVRPAPVLRAGSGGEPGQPPVDYAADAWRRLVIRAQEDQLVLTLLGRRAAAPQGVHGLLADVERLIGEPGRTPTTDPAWLTMLWHLLVPAELRSGLWGNLQLAVDERAAGLPWEMLATQDRLGQVQPLGLRAGMVRQLVDLEADVRLMSANQATGGGHALVVGDPPTQRLPRLAGARREAVAVAERLEARGLSVQRLIFDETDTGDRSAQVLAALYRQPWEIVHIAAHGEHQPADPGRSGVILGPDQVLTGEHVASLSSTPQLVVLNCCHLARVDRSTVTVAGTPETQNALPRFAAGVAQSLMRHGVRAVVAAGWAVDDVPAALFATTLYDRLLDGMAYGQAVRLARAAIHAEHPRSATWGAYQCYGAAGFQIRRPRGGETARVHPVGSSELVRELTRLRMRATVLRPVQELRQELDDLLELSPSEWRQLPECAQAIGAACAEGGDFDQAVTWYQRAVEHHDGVATVATIEQLVNLRSRASSFDLAGVRTRLEWLLELGETSERCAMLGGAYKRHAASLKSPAARRNNAEHALEHYQRALELAQDDLYVLPNVLQLEAILGEVRPGGRERLAQLVGTADRSGFHAAASTGDLLLLDYLDGARATIDEVRSAYVEALEAEPTHRQWDSVVEQVRVLAALSGDEQLAGLVDELTSAPGRLGEQRQAAAQVAAAGSGPPA